MIQIIAPNEFDPVELIRKAQFLEPHLKYHHFAVAFGVSDTTIKRWMAGMRSPEPLAKYRAWALKTQWGIDD